MIAPKHLPAAASVDLSKFFKSLLARERGNDFPRDNSSFYWSLCSN